MTKATIIDFFGFGFEQYIFSALNLTWVVLIIKSY
jgi:hypothetical protein